MKLKKREIDGILVVYVEGNLIGSPENSDTFHSFFRSLLKDGHRNIVVNLESAPWANSKGIGLLIGANTRVTTAGGELVLSDAKDRIHNVLTVTKLDRILATLDTETDALRHFGGKASLTVS